MALLGFLLAGHGLLFWYSWPRARLGYPDFTIFYTAGKMIRLGQGHNLYNPASQYSVQQTFASQVQIRNGALPFNHPAFEALLFVPLAGLDYAKAFIVWDLLNLALIGSLPFLLRPHIPLMRRASPFLWFIVLLAFFPILATFMQGQDAILLLLLDVLAFTALARGSDHEAGFWLALGLFRPQLVIPLVVILVCWKRWKIIPSFLGTAAILAGVSVGVTGWNGALRYPKYVLHLEKISGQAAIFPAVMPNLRGLIAGWYWAGDSRMATAVVILVSLFLLGWIIRTGTKAQTSDAQFGLKFAFATLTTVLVSYHAYAYDLSLLIIPALLVGNQISGRRDRKPAIVLWLPVALLFCTPLYVWLGFRVFQLNLLAIIELLWLWGIRDELSVPYSCSM